MLTLVREIRFKKCARFHSALLCKHLISQQIMESHCRTDKDRPTIAVCQMTATKHVSDNLETVSKLIKTAKQNKAQVIFLPEACDYIGDHSDHTVGLASALNGDVVNNYCKLASENQVWLSIGGIHEKISDGKIHNAHLLINHVGDIVSVYRKVHLYDVDLPEKNIQIQESTYTQRGGEIVPPVNSPVGKIGLSICYDLRFPEMSLMLTKMGAEILTFPSAFMKPTGEAHWESLLRARAIECQAYVVAAAQVGAHNSKRMSWGHAMIVDPWGTVIAECTGSNSIIYATVDLEFLRDVRKQMPVWEQRRYDLYPELLPMCPKTSSSSHELACYQFGQTTVTAGSVFFKTEKTFAFTNRRCVVPGHVLVAPIRCCKRMLDMTPGEVADLFVSVQKVQSVMERVHCVSSTTITVQDGEHAGQSIQHVHVHVLPRQPGDFAENDQIYYELQQHDKPGSPIRSIAEMEHEALVLRRYFH